VLCGLGI